MMKVMVDTNVILDHLLDREPFADDAEKILSLSEGGELCGVMSASAATDIYYILRKRVGHERSKEFLKTLFSILDIIEVGKSDLLRAMDTQMTDYEDALVASCAKRVKAECIVTRNTDDYGMSPVPAMTPADFLSRFFPEE